MSDGVRAGEPVTRVGVMGAGQLGRMLALSGIPLGMHFTFYSPTPEAPAEDVGRTMIGSYDDADALTRFARSVDVVTYEFENVPVHAAELVGAVCPVWPPRAALEVTQDRLREKETFTSLGIATAPHAAVDSLDDLRAAVASIGVPGILKTRRLGYDGKGQARISDEAGVAAAWAELGGAPLIYEGFVNFERELSVIAVRAQDGETRVYPVVQNEHREGILRRTTAPAPGLSAAKREQAESYATSLVSHFGYVGTFALELFDTEQGLVANEMAPRVHNSGHWTIEGAETSQFENHIRAVAGLPLGSCSSVGSSVMLNVIGTAPLVARVLAVPDAHVHMYGKSERPGRKLGHVTIRSASPEVARARADELGAIL